MPSEEYDVIDPTVDPSGGEPESPKEPAKPVKETPVDPKEFRSLQAQFAGLQKQLEETRESERYWAERAKAGNRGDAAPLEPEDEEEPPVVTDDDPDKFVEAISKKGVAALVDRGVLTKAQASELLAKERERLEKRTREIVAEVVERERGKLSADAEIIGKYPDLRNKESALFKKTQEIFRAAVSRSPAKAQDPEALLDAAERARLALRIEELEGKGGDEDYETAEERRERGRRERIVAQTPTRRGRSSSEVEDDHTGRMGPEAEAVARQMGISNDEFRESQKRLKGGQ